MEKFYFLRDKDRKPVVTVYLIKNDIGIGKGISICSKKDAINKRVGITIAKQRAQWALKSRIFDLPILRNESCSIYYGINKVVFVSELYKSQYNPDLTAREEELLSEAPQNP